MFCSYRLCKTRDCGASRGRHQSTFGSYRKDLYIFGQEICGNPPPAPPPQYPGSSTERRVCLEGTRKDSTGSGASPWTAAAHAAGTHRTHYWQWAIWMGLWEFRRIYLDAGLPVAKSA
jgi:hypothetical protein